MSATNSHSRVVASHLRDFADFLPAEKREDFNATVDDLLAVSDSAPIRDVPNDDRVDDGLRGPQDLAQRCVVVPLSVMEQIDAAIKFYASIETYLPPRTGGVAEGCPRSGMPPIQADRGNAASDVLMELVKLYPIVSPTPNRNDDKARLDWLDRPGCWLEPHEGDAMKSWFEPRKQTHFYINGKYTKTEGPTARAAIDAAIERQSERKGE